MPQRSHRFLKLVGRLVFLALFGWALAIVRAVRPRGWDEFDTDSNWSLSASVAAETPRKQKQEAVRTRRPARARLATSGALVLVFFAAATFTAGAGDVIAKALDPAHCSSLMQTTGEDESICSQPEQLQTPDATVAAAAAAAEAAPKASAPAPEALPAAEQAEVVPEQAPDASAAAPAEAAPAAEAAPSGDSGPAADAAAPDANAPAPEASAPAAQPADEPEADPRSYVLPPQRISAQAKAKQTSKHWVVNRAKEAKAKAPVVEHEGDGAATVWLNRALPDPTPPAKRLSPRFAKQLQHIAAANGVSWALVLGVLRAEGARNRVPASAKELNTLAQGLRMRGAIDNEWDAVLSLSGRSAFADRAVALANYNRAVGLAALVQGLEKAKTRLAQEILSDPRINVYGPGREDLVSGRVDVRVVVLIRYLAQTYGEVTISSLISGHRLYARPGVISAHIPGHAVDIATIGGTSILGHQEPGSITEKAVRSILLLPVELQPRQVISLLGLGGPSFPLADHSNHIHVGY